MANSAYSWVPFYEELADKIRSLNDDGHALFVKLREMDIWDRPGLDFPQLDADTVPEDGIEIDPFTFYAQFNKKNFKSENRKTVCEAIKESFQMGTPVPADFDGIPFVMNQSKTFYAFKDDNARGANDIGNLWKLFDAALDYADSPSDGTKAEFVESYDRALSQKNVKWNIAMGLFWVRPRCYLPLDGRTRWFLALPRSMDWIDKSISCPPAGMPDEIAAQSYAKYGNGSPNKGTVPEGEDYLAFVEKCKRVLEQGGYGDYHYASFPELYSCLKPIAVNVYDQDKAIKNGHTGSQGTGDVVTSDFDDNEDEAVVEDESANPLKASRNLVYFGAPGTGKSKKMNDQVHHDFQDRYERVTFYADYQHAQFVGSYKPITVNGDITYKFRPGPFTRVLVQALNGKKHGNYALVIEELNRAEAASVFGDLFQLLDRSKNGMSEYPVSVSEDLREFLASELTDDGKEYLRSQIAAGTENNVSANTDCSRIVIPENMYIWATMNSADQGVYPLDTAFKRRWDFQYIGIDEGEEKSKMPLWNAYRKKLNGLLRQNGVNEDKLIGPFFIRCADFVPDSHAGTDEFDNAMKNKVLMYLFEDAAKYHRDIFDIPGFEDNALLSLQTLFDKWDKYKFRIFRDMDTVKVAEPSASPEGVDDASEGESDTE